MGNLALTNSNNSTPVASFRQFKMTAAFNYLRVAKHHRSFEEDLNDSNLHLFPFWKYSPEELSNLTVQNAKTSIFGKYHTLKERNADFSFLHVIFAVEFPEWAAPEDIHLLLANYFKIFDWTLFFGSLQDNINFNTYSSESEEGARFGSYQSYDNSVNINIHPIRAKAGSFQQRMRGYLAILVHEQLHAFIGIYSCHCVGACHNRAQDPTVCGKSGHGALWCDAMIAIQDRLTTDLGWDLDCAITGGVKEEMKTTGWEPTHEQLERWRYDRFADTDSDEETEPTV